MCIRDRPHDHPLLQDLPLTLEKIASYPIVTYDYGFTGGTLVGSVFHDAGIEPNVVLTAIDADVIKTYVTLGLGIGLLAQMAYDPVRDSNLAMLDVSHLFPMSTTYLGVRKDAFLRGFMIDFMQLLAPAPVSYTHLDVYKRQIIFNKILDYFNRLL